MSIPAIDTSVVERGQSTKGLRWFQRKPTDLPNPGPFEALHKEVRETFLQHLLFDGAKIDFNKPLSNNFQLSHTLSMGSMDVPPLYQFGSIFSGKDSFLQGQMDTLGNLQARVNYAPIPSIMTKTQMAISAKQSMVQLEADYMASDFTVGVKVANPDVANGSGVFVVSYLQSVTKKLALGAETMYQRAPNGLEDSAVTLVGRYTGSNFIATANVVPNGTIQASYYHKINEKVHVGTELVALCNATNRESIGTVGCRFDFRQATFRTQLDTTGRVSAFLEEKLSPGLSFVLSGDIEHTKGQGKFGFGLVFQ